MSKPWLHVVGIGEDGMDGLSVAARALVRSAEVLVGSERHHELTAGIDAQRESWPTPFNLMLETLQRHKGRRIVVLVSGDPLWYSAGARLGRAMDPAEIIYHPHISAFQWAGARMGWSMADLATLTVHGRPVERIIPFFEPGARLLILAKDKTTPGEVARLLIDRGYGASSLTALAHLGGPEEQRFGGTASDWQHDVPDLHTLAVECRFDPDARFLSRSPGLPDDAFTHDGNLTKQEVRAATLAKLSPARYALLWDVGLGCGSVAIEWMRAARDAKAIGIEPREDRRALAAANALALGAPELEIVEGEAPEALDGLPEPDAVFIGGGLSQAVFDACWSALKPGGRLVANGVTLESESLLLDLAGRHGGALSRLSVERAEKIGSRHGWKPSMAVTQWSLSK